MHVRGHQHEGYAGSVEFNCPSCGHHFQCCPGCCPSLKKANRGAQGVTKLGVGAVIGTLIGGPIGGVLGGILGASTGYSFSHSCSCGAMFSVKV